MCVTSYLEKIEGYKQKKVVVESPRL